MHPANHSHDRAPTEQTDFGRAFAIGAALNISFVAIQIVAGLFAHSLALMADAGHNLGDTLGLLLAWLASRLTKIQPSERRTYGFGRSSILAALTNAIFLLVAVGGISWEAIRRFGDPAPVAGDLVIWTALLGIAVNGGTAFLFLRERHGDLNVRGAFLHMAADAAVSAGVVIAGIIIYYSHWFWLDPVSSLIINAIIVVGTWGLLRDSMNLVLDAVPEGIDTKSVRRYLQELPGVTEVHDLHIWALSTTQTALTAHLIKPDAHDDDRLLARASEDLQKNFQITHSTIQLERGDERCRLSSDHIV